MNTQIGRDDVHRILMEADRYEWQVQGFGMLRTYLDGPLEPRLQIWDQRLATWHNNAIHDHPWAFRSVIFAGMIYNQRFDVDMNAWNRNGHTTEIIPGIRGGRLSERPVVPCLVTPQPVEVYAMGDEYTQTHREMHLTRYLQGTVTLIERFDREEADVARIAWYGDGADQPPFVNPYEPTRAQIEQTVNLALETWFTVSDSGRVQ